LEDTLSTQATVQQTSDAPAEKRRYITLWGLTVLFVVFAMLTSGYLSFTELTDTETVCVQNSTFNCDAVLNSIWSKFAGIPVSYIGFVSYSIMLVILLLEKRVSFFKQYGVYILMGLVLFDFMYHMYLTYNAVFNIRALCIWCVLTHIACGFILILTGIRMVIRILSSENPTTAATPT
jgi:uncharacterized membrane protein